MREDHRQEYHRIVRRVLALSVLLGWVLGNSFSVSALGVAAYAAVLLVV